MLFLIPARVRVQKTALLYVVFNIRHIATMGITHYICLNQQQTREEGREDVVNNYSVTIFWGDNKYSSVTDAFLRLLALPLHSLT